LQLRARGPTGFSYDGVGVPHYGAPALRFGTALTSNDLGHVTPRSVNRSIQAKLNRSGPSPRCGPSRVFSLAALLLSSHRARPSLCPSPTLQGVSYVEHPRELASLYIRTIIPARGDPSPAVLALSDRPEADVHGAVNFVLTAFSEVPASPWRCPRRPGGPRRRRCALRPDDRSFRARRPRRPPGAGSPSPPSVRS
jgi:hypothetical protein